MAASTNTDASVSVRAKIAEIREIENTSGLVAAERAMVEYIREGAQSHLAFLALARLLMKQRKFDDAARAATRAKTLAPLEAEPLIALGIVNIRLKELPRAAEAFASAIRLDRNSARAHLGAAAVKMADEDYDDAMVLCARALELDPSMERAHELIARINIKRGRKDLAIDGLKGVIERNPENKRVLRAYIRLMKSEGRGDEVIALMEKQAAADPDDRARMGRLSRVAVQAGRPEIAVEQYGRAIEDGTANVGDKVRYIMALVHAGQLAKAREILDGFGDQRVLQPVIAKLDGDILLKSGDAAQAIKRYREACRSARVDMLSAEAERTAESVNEKAKLWKAHAAKSVTAAFRQRRSSGA